MALSIRERRTSLGLSQPELGRLLGVSGDTVAAWENERNRPTGERRERVMRWLDGDLSERTTPHGTTDQTAAEDPSRGATSGVPSASSTDDQMVMTRPAGVTDVEWAELRADQWERYATWLATRVRTAVDAAE
jgi:transcriptional regulator with XRE-family HTH domain